MSDAAWASVMALPSTERDLVRHCTLTSKDMAALATKRSSANRLGAALQLCAMRHPGRAFARRETALPSCCDLDALCQGIGFQAFNSAA